MLLTILLVISVITFGILGVIYYIMYIRVRLKDRGHPDEPKFSPSQLAELDRLESRYLSGHFTWMLLFFLTGVALLIRWGVFDPPSL